MNYWAERMARAQDAKTAKSIKATEKQLKQYYGQSMERVIGQFEKTYNRLFSSIAEGRQVTPADLYKLDTYWQMQGQLRQELKKLGDKQISLLSKQFELNFFEVYYSIAVPGSEAFSTISAEAAHQMINQIWCTDGKSWSQRIWTNTDKLQDALNAGLIDCVVTGKKTTELKTILQEQFNVSYHRADSVVRTELAHIQTQAAQQRYRDYGIQEVEVFVDEDERTCPICAGMEGKRYPINAQMPVPMHPRCRCCMVPVVEQIIVA